MTGSRLAALVGEEEASRPPRSASSDVGMARGPQLLGNLRQVDAILAVLDGFSPDATPRTISRR